MNEIIPLAVSVSEAARLCGIGRTKFSELISKGEVPSKRMGRRRLILLNDLHAFLAGLPGN